jgi:hypothetical protein
MTSLTDTSIPPLSEIEPLPSSVQRRLAAAMAAARQLAEEEGIELPVTAQQPDTAKPPAPVVQTQPPPEGLPSAAVQAEMDYLRRCCSTSPEGTLRTLAENYVKQSIDQASLKRSMKTRQEQSQPVPGKDAMRQEQSQPVPDKDAMALKELAHFWEIAIACDDVDQALKHLAIYLRSVLGHRDLSMMAHAVRELKLHDVFKLPLEQVEAQAGKVFDRVYNDIKVKDKPTLPIFLVGGQIQRRIPEAKFHTKRQRLYPIELAFVLKRITLGLLDAQRKGKRQAIAAHDYFLSDKMTAAFRKATGRRLGSQKLRESLNVLEEFGFISRQNWKTRGKDTFNRHKPTTYTRGKQPIELPSVLLIHTPPDSVRLV